MGHLMDQWEKYANVMHVATNARGQQAGPEFSGQIEVNVGSPAATYNHILSCNM
jgi:hypothetical protein